MYASKSILLIASIAFLSGCTTQPQKPPCTSEEACLKDRKCLCWCSQGCGFREKTEEDHPLYIENDPNEKFCYCKQWDLDNYEARCIEGKEIEQPKGAK